MGVQRDGGGYDGGKPPEWAVHTNVEVDVTGLTDFADHLLAEYQHNLAPNWQKIAPHLEQSQFGRSVGFEEAFHVARRHDHILTDAKMLMSQYANGLSALSDAAAQLARDYGGADDLAALDVSRADVDAVFRSGRGDGGAAAAAPPPPR